MVSRRPASTRPHTATAGMPPACAAACDGHTLALERKALPAQDRRPGDHEIRSSDRVGEARPGRAPRSAPSRRSAPRTASPKPSPAPAPGAGRTVQSHRRAGQQVAGLGPGPADEVDGVAERGLDELGRGSASAPTSGPWVAATPARPSRGCWRSPRPTSWVAPNRPIAVSRAPRLSARRSTRWAAPPLSAARPAAVDGWSGMSRPSIPRPASSTSDPVRPRTIRRGRRRRAASSRSPTPPELAAAGSSPAVPSGLWVGLGGLGAETGLLHLPSAGLGGFEIDRGAVAADEHRRRGRATPGIVDGHHLYLATDGRRPSCRGNRVRRPAQRQ
jgi:hypothetical protein